MVASTPRPHLHHSQRASLQSMDRVLQVSGRFRSSHPDILFKLRTPLGRCTQTWNRWTTRTSDTAAEAPRSLLVPGLEMTLILLAPPARRKRAVSSEDFSVERT